MVKIEKWKHAKKFVYSVTYDEALEALFEYVVPLHDEFKIPGHVEVVVGQVGEIRNIGNSSFNGMKHMSVDKLKYLQSKGWGVGSHSITYTHSVEDGLINIMTKILMILLKSLEKFQILS